MDSLAEWSKAVDSSSTIFGCVGSNPTAVISTSAHVTSISIQYTSALTSRMRVSAGISTLVSTAATSETLSKYLKSSDGCQVPQPKTHVLRVMFSRLRFRSCSTLAARNSIQNDAPNLVSRLTE